MVMLCEIWYALLTSNQTPVSLSSSEWKTCRPTLKPSWVSECFGFRSNRTPCRCRCCRATGHLWHETEWGALMSAEVDYKTRRRGRCKVAVPWMQISARQPDDNPLIPRPIKRPRTRDELEFSSAHDARDYSHKMDQLERKSEREREQEGEGERERARERVREREQEGEWERERESEQKNDSPNTVKALKVISGSLIQSTSKKTPVMKQNGIRVVRRSAFVSLLLTKDLWL